MEGLATWFFTQVYVERFILINHDPAEQLLKGSDSGIYRRLSGILKGDHSHTYSPIHGVDEVSEGAWIRPSVCILGAGAVGLSLAGKLASSASVSVACRPAHAAAIRERGLLMSGTWGDQTVLGITCISGPEEFPPDIDYVIVTAKGTDTLKICREYKDVIRSRPVVTLQNGIGNEEIISRFARVTIGGTIITNFSVEGTGHVRVKSESGPVTVGLWGDRSPASVLTGFVSLMEHSGIAIRTCPDIQSAKWGKSLLNIAVNPLCALLTMPVGGAADESLLPVISGLIHETFAVMQAQNIVVEWRSAEEYLVHLYHVQIPDFSEVYPSMFYDIRDHKMTEIDLLNGYIEKEGKRFGIPTPYNQCISDLIRAKQKQAL